MPALHGLRPRRHRLVDMASTAAAVASRRFSTVPEVDRSNPADVSLPFRMARSPESLNSSSSQEEKPCSPPLRLLRQADGDSNCHWIDVNARPAHFIRAQISKLR